MELRPVHVGAIRTTPLPLHQRGCRLAPVRASNNGTSSENVAPVDQAAAKGKGKSKKAAQGSSLSGAAMQAAAARQPEPAQPEPSSPSSSSSPAARPMASPARRGPSETPQVVVDRIFRRILTFAGAPVALGMALFPLFYYLKVQLHVDYPMWLVLGTQSLTFGGGLLGITYGALSASWDASREGSAWGWTEFKANTAVLMSKEKQ